MPIPVIANVDSQASSELTRAGVGVGFTLSRFEPSFYFPRAPKFLTEKTVKPDVDFE
jgi:hypothetical protein